MKITDYVYALESTKGAYAYIVLDTEIVLIDTGFAWVGKKILKELKSMNIKLEDIKHIILTHHDLDHVGNVVLLQKLTGAMLWASNEDIPYIKGYKIRPGIKRILAWFPKVKKPEKIYGYNKYERIGDVEIIPTPGHTPGHVCMLYKDALFVGDLVKSEKGRLIPYPNLNWDEDKLMESIKKVTGLQFKWVCTAHGIPMERGTKWEMM